MGWIMNGGDIGLNKVISGLVNFTKTLIKKNCESSFWKMFIATLPISVHMITPSI